MSQEQERQAWGHVGNRQEICKWGSWFLLMLFCCFCIKIARWYCHHRKEREIDLWYNGYKCSHEIQDLGAPVRRKETSRRYQIHVWLQFCLCSTRAMSSSRLRIKNRCSRWWFVNWKYRSKISILNSFFDFTVLPPEYFIEFTKDSKIAAMLLKP